MISQADVVDDEASLLALRHPVHAGDGLEQIMLLEPLVDVHDLFDRRVEAGQQHVTDHQECDPGVGLVVVVEIEGLAEALNRIPVLRFLTRGRDFSGLVGRVRGDDDRHLQESDPPDQIMVRLGFRTFSFQPLLQGFAQGPLIAHGGQL
ncbi:hypothetical protein D3C87_1359770 [compost metagenome]